MSEPPVLREIAVQYHKAGWHPLELPEGAKAPPPEGRTGYGGSDMTIREIEDAGWMGNIGLRMPPDVLGLDIDVYHDGDRTLQRLFAEHGDLPPTWISHSNRGDGSGIRFYRVPPGLTWVTGLPGVEIIQRNHRYSVVFPSVHPDGRPYDWGDQVEAVAIRSGQIPTVENLPELPWPWIGELSRAQPADVATRSQAVDLPELRAFLEEHDQAAAPGYVTNVIVAHFTGRVREGYSRHDTMQHCLTWAMECVAAGIAAAMPTIHQLAEEWVLAVAPDERRSRIWAEGRTTEFEAMLRHAIGKVKAKAPAELLRLHDEIAGVPMRPAPPPAPAVEMAGQPALSDDGLPRRIDWPTFAMRDTSGGRRWLIEGLWPWGRAMALWAGAKTGKSELALWCAAKLALGQHPWTGAPIEPIDVAYFDFEMTEDDLDERLADFAFDPAELGRLHYFLLPALHALDVEKGGEEVERLVAAAGAQAVVFDTFGRAVGGDENDADTVRAFYRHTGSRLKRNGVAYLRTDHAGKDITKGQRGSSAKRDDVDVVWSMTRGKGSVVLLDCAGSSRLSWVGPNLKLDRIVANDVVSYTSPMRWGWPAGTAAKAAALDALGVPQGAGRPTAEKALRDAGLPIGRKIVLEAALKYRRDPSQMSSELDAERQRGSRIREEDTGQ